MKTPQNIKKDAMSELAWKQLIEAVKPLRKSGLPAKKPYVTKGLKHPALLTITDFYQWEILG